jgi:7-cyano-7-deazaguanine synthase
MNAGIRAIMKNKKAIVLLSGGLDSTTTLALAKSEGYEVYAISFDYGQKNRFELERAAVIAELWGVVQHKKVLLDLRVFGGSSLTTSTPIEKNRSFTDIGHGIPNTYVPARNTLFLSYALAWAEVIEAADIFIGVNAIDTSGYPDCRPEFIAAFGELANLATKMGTAGGQRITIHAPLQNLTKAQIINLGAALGVDYSLTNSCYDPLPDAIPCGSCDACMLRQKGFYEAGLVDPLPYQKRLAKESCL